MSKKGLLTLQVEIDYDQMITEETIPALAGYTGKATFDELAKWHMANLGDKVDEVLKDLPFVRYQIKGDLIPIQQEEEKPSTFGEWVKEVEEMEVPVSLPVDERDVVEEEVVDLPSQRELVGMLEEDVEHVSMTYGMPQRILVNELMMNSLKDYVAQLSEVESLNGDINKYNGFEIVLEGMEELFIIEYKTYGSNEIKTHSRML